MADIFYKRRSNRYLSNTKLKESEVDEILKAGELAPVALGRYDDIILNIFQGEALEELKTIYKEKLKRDIFYDGGLFILVTQKEAKPELANQNAGAIIENMLLKATELNIGSVFIFQPVRGALNDSELYKALKIEDGYVPISGATFGYKKNEIVKDINHLIRKKYLN